MEDFQTQGSILKGNRSAHLLITKALQHNLFQRREAQKYGFHRDPLGKALPFTYSWWHQSWLLRSLVCSWIPHNCSFQKSLNIIKCYLAWCTLLIIQLLFSYLNGVLNSFQKKVLPLSEETSTPQLSNKRKSSSGNRNASFSSLVSFINEINLYYMLCVYLYTDSYSCIHILYINILYALYKFLIYVRAKFYSLSQ